MLHDDVWSHLITMIILKDMIIEQMVEVLYMW